MENTAITAKKLGIWMDHAHAHLIEFTTDPIVTTIITSKFTHAEKLESMNKGEKIMHIKEQHEQAYYYKRIGEVIKHFEEVLLFGPTDAKVELFNTLKDDKHFDKIKIDMQQTDKMTEHQEHAFVRNYFKNHL